MRAIYISMLRMLLMWTQLMRSNKLALLKRSHFRRRFHLSTLDRAILDRKGIEQITLDAETFVRKHLYYPQTPSRVPYNGHPVFTAQHATATCCRECLFKWHRIPPFRNLTEPEVAFVVDLIVRWIQKDAYLPRIDPKKERRFEAVTLATYI